MKYDIIIWDFNGTIIDDVNLCYEILEQLLKENNLPPASLKKYRDEFYFPVKEYYRDMGFDVSNYEKLSKRFMELYQDESLKCDLYPKMVETLKTIKENNVLQVCLSASQVDNLNRQLKHFKIDTYFDFILGLSNIFAKSKLNIAKIWLKDNHLENKKILCVGDSTHDFEVANALNADCALMSYGHFSKDRLLKTKAMVFDNLDELMNYLTK